MVHSERFIKLVDEARPRIKEVTPDETHAKLEGDGSSVLIDIREDHEWERGHIVGATHLSRGILERDIEKLVPDLDREIILYCGGGFRSVLAADSLKQMGYSNVKSMSSGWRGWLARGLPATEPQDPTEQSPDVPDGVS